MKKKDTFRVAPNIFVRDSYRASVKLYRNTILILWLLPSAHSGDKLRLVMKVSRDLALIPAVFLSRRGVWKEVKS